MQVVMGIFGLNIGQAGGHGDKMFYGRGPEGFFAYFSDKCGTALLQRNLNGTADFNTLFHNSHSL
jgi:hypothetical protein